MATSTFRCRLITPEAQVFDDPAVAAVIPMWDGLLGVLPGRAPMVMQMGTGELRVDFPGSGGSRSFFVDDGFVQMVNNELTILAANAVASEKLTEADAQAELNEARARKTEGASATEVARVRAARNRAEAKLRVARGRRVR
ncbi:MAG: F0F1 ATP synthase subunit epsilon [Phycisphaerales bacterium]|nr:F0F1 ATP synthase subunit epsilon [Phycisphaerales bacterium]